MLQNELEKVRTRGVQKTMSEAARIDLNTAGHAPLSRKPAVRTVCAAVCCVAVLALVVSGFSNHGSSESVLPATVIELLSKPVEQSHASKESAVVDSALSLDQQAVQLRMLQQIASSIKMQESKLKAGMSEKKQVLAQDKKQTYEKTQGVSLRAHAQAPHVESSAGALVSAAAASHGANSMKGKNTRLMFKPDETVSRANSMVAEAQKRWSELHKKVGEATNPASTSRDLEPHAAATRSASKNNNGESKHGDLNTMATKADEEAASAIDAVDAQRVIVAREASTYMKAEKRALVVQERAALAEAKADTARALVEDAVAKNAENRAKMFRRRAGRASAKAVKYAGQIKTLDDDAWA